MSGDTLRKMNTTDDIFQIYSKFGYQVHKYWYVSMFADFRTNFFPNFQKNSNHLNTTFLTPIRYNMGLGIDYKPLKGLSVNISPVTYKLTYALNTDVERIDVNELGIETGSNMLNEVGSSVRVEWKWRPLREIELETKFYFFTNYKKGRNRVGDRCGFLHQQVYVSQNLLHPRYDGTVESTTDDKSRLQFKELISVGFAHTFR